MGSIPGSGRCPGGGHGNPLQYSCPWTEELVAWATIQRVAKSWTQLNKHVHILLIYHTLDIFKEYTSETFVNPNLHKFKHLYKILAYSQITFPYKNCSFYTYHQYNKPSIPNSYPISINLFLTWPFFRNIFTLELLHTLHGGSDSKASVYNAGDPGSIPGLGRSPGEGNGNPLQYYCLVNPMDRGAW